MDLIQIANQMEITKGIYACLHGRPFYITIENKQYIGKNDPIIFIPAKDLQVYHIDNDFAFVWQYGDVRECNIYYDWNYNLTWSFNKEELIPFFERQDVLYQ